MSATELIARLPPDQLGGAKVFRPTSLFGRTYTVGEVVPTDVLRRVPRQNLRALMDQRFIVAWPVGVAAPSVVVDEEAYVYNRIGTNRYDVVVGRRLNDDPLTKAEAEKLAAAHRRPAAA